MKNTYKNITNILYSLSLLIMITPLTVFSATNTISFPEKEPSSFDWTWLIGTIVVTTGIISGILAVVNVLSPSKTVKEEALRNSSYLNDIKSNIETSLDDVHEKITKIEDDIKAILAKLSDNREDLREENELLKIKIIEETKQLMDENKKSLELMKKSNKEEILNDINKKQEELYTKLDCLLQQILDMLQ